MPYVKQIARGNLLSDTGNPDLGLCDNRERWDGEGAGRGVQEGGAMCTPVADSRRCRAETRTILQLASN